MIKFKLGLIFLATCSVNAEARTKKPPIDDPALLNIGFVCRWQNSCILKQKKAMNRSLQYVRERRPPVWKIQLCNRNAARNGTRKDWIGFDSCIRNPNVRALLKKTERARGR